MSPSAPVSRRVLLVGTASAALANVVACRGKSLDHDGSSAEASTARAAPTTRAGPTTVASPTATVAEVSINSSPPPSSTSTAAPTPVGYFPPADGAGEWTTATAAEAGYTDEGLAEVVALVEAANSQSLVILSAGSIVAEQYWRGADASTARDVASVQKSVVSTLVGLARDRGLLALDEPVNSFLGAGWSRAAAADEAIITVFHLLTMTSGLDPRNLRSDAPAGTVWDYNTDAYQRLRPVLEAASGLDINTLTSEWLFAPIGIGSAAPWAPRGAMTDAMGEAAWGLSLTAREMARFGLFAMRAGRWAREQITAVDWFEKAWTPIASKADYGYLWWLLGRGRNGQQGTIPDLVAALGAADQKIYVSPATDLVLARQGAAARAASEAQSDFDALLIAALSRART